MDILNKLILNEISLSQALYYLCVNCKDSFDIEIANWLTSETNGYHDALSLPDYRIIDCAVYAKYVDELNNLHEEELDVTKIDEYLISQGHNQVLVSKMRLFQNIESLEKSIEGNKGGVLIMPFTKSMSEMIGQWFHCPAGCNNLTVYQQCRLEQGRYVLTTVKNKLIGYLGDMKFDDCVKETSNISTEPLVFISHASKDKDFLKLFVDNILKKGLNLTDKNIVFTSYEATGVVPGDNIPEYIKRNIAGANIVLAMISDNYKKSEVCMNEVGAAWALGKTPVQIMLPNTNIEKLGWLIHLDKAARIDDRDSLDSLEEVLCESMGLKIPTAKHWNPCTKDFLDAIKEIPQCYNDEQPEFMVVDKNGQSSIECHVRFIRNNYREKYNVEDNPKDFDAKQINPALFGGITSELIASIEKSVARVTPSELKLITRTINYSYARVQLHLINNSRYPIENGRLIIQADNDRVLFANSNVKEKNSIAAIKLPRANQNIYSNGVRESFQKPINPTADEVLYDFYITAPYDTKSFKLLWKLESLKEPKFGEVQVNWIADIEDTFKYVSKENPKLGVSEIVDYNIDE